MVTKILLMICLEVYRIYIGLCRINEKYGFENVFNWISYIENLYSLFYENGLLFSEGMQKVLLFTLLCISINVIKSK